MAVTHAPAGFTGTVDQIAEAQRFALSGGGRFRVNSSADWALTANAAVRTVNIAAGSASACGVYDTTTAADTVTFAANAGGSIRYDAIVATFDWLAGTISFRVIQGTTVVPVIVRTGTTVDATKINWLPGTRYDAVLGVIAVRPGVTTLAPADLYDKRPWGAWGRLNVTTSGFGEVLDADLGQRLRDSNTGSTWEWTGVTTGWVKSPFYLFSQWVPDSGFSTPGSVNQGMVATTSATPATAAGPVQVVAAGEMVSSLNAAAFVGIAWSTSSGGPFTGVDGSSRRVHNYGDAAPIPFTCMGYIDSPGVPIWLVVTATTDGAGGSLQIVQSVITVWRL